MSSSDASSPSRRRPRSVSPPLDAPEDADARLTEQFYEKVWDETRLVPYGQVTSYGHIAKRIGSPRHSRLVGQALKFLPRRLARSPTDDDDDASLLVPWHRVVSSAGKISLRGSSDATERQAARLRAEGVEVRGGGAGTGDGGRISLTQYGHFPSVVDADSPPSGDRRVRQRRE